MPAVGVVDGGWVVGEVFEGEEEGGEADELVGWLGWSVYGIWDMGYSRGEGEREMLKEDTYVDSCREGDGGGGGERLKRVFIAHIYYLLGL